MKASGLEKYNCGGIPSHGTRKSRSKHEMLKFCG